MILSSILQRFRKKPMLPFAADENMRRIAPLAEEFFAKVLYDEEPLFVSDEATVWDVSSDPSAEELLEGCFKVYGVTLHVYDLRRQLWRLIEHLDHARANIGPAEE